MKIISLFNNKGGVGKTTLAFHLSWALTELKYKVLMIDFDPQCNMSLCVMDEKKLEHIWDKENDFISNFEDAKNEISPTQFNEINNECRTIHYILKPTEEGTGELQSLPPPYKVLSNLDLIPGRLTLHKYEYKISERWSGAYQGDPLSIRTITRIRSIALDYAKKNNYDYVIIDTSPSLGALNKVIISTTDGFVIPCLPDMFSLYGIRNIGESLDIWKKELDTIYNLISDRKREYFPDDFVQFLGYTIYNARKYEGTTSTKWDLARAHYNYAEKIPSTILKYIPADARKNLNSEMIANPIGETAVMHSHNTLTGMSQKYKVPIWKVPDLPTLDKDDRPTILGNRSRYEATRNSYIEFAKDMIKRIDTIG